MTLSNEHEQSHQRTNWETVTLSLLSGIIVLGSMVFLVGLFPPPGLSPPPANALPLFVFVVTAGVMSFILVQRTHAAGFVGAVVTGILAVLAVIVIVTGLADIVPSVGPAIFSGLGVLAIVIGIVGWRRRTRGP